MRALRAEQHQILRPSGFFGPRYFRPTLSRARGPRRAIWGRGSSIPILWPTQTARARALVRHDGRKAVKATLAIKDTPNGQAKAHRCFSTPKISSSITSRGTNHSQGSRGNSRVAPTTDSLAGGAPIAPASPSGGNDHHRKNGDSN